jgi:hypothetical protein
LLLKPLIQQRLPVLAAAGLHHDLFPPATDTAAERRRGIATQLDGAPPTAMDTHQDLLHALNTLVTARFRSQRAMCRIHNQLNRATVSAALGDRRSLGMDLMNTILQACGVRDTDQQAWLAEWRRLARPRQQAALERQRMGYSLADAWSSATVIVIHPPACPWQEDDLEAI